MGFTHTRQFFELPNASTILWDGDRLVDVLSGVSLTLAGSVSPGLRGTAYPFDRAIGVRNGEVFWSVAYENRGTKGLLFKDGEVQRELNRSYYFAKEYDYPVALAVRP